MTSYTRNARLTPKDGKSPHKALKILLGIVGLLAVAGLLIWGAVKVFCELDRITDEQCRIVDADLDVVVVTPGRMVQADVVTLHFGLTNGANLAEIDFDALRTKLLTRVPNVRDISIERRMPNRVTIEVKERDPIARVASRAKNSPSGLMVDTEGVIFRFARSAATYPVVRTGADIKLAPGERLTGRAAAALTLIETAALPELIALNVQEVDSTPKDYVLVTLGNYSRAKIAWEHMDTDSRLSRDSLKRQLKRLLEALNTNLASQTATWIVTDYGTPGRVYAAENDR